MLPRPEKPDQAAWLRAGTARRAWSKRRDAACSLRDVQRKMRVSGRRTVARAPRNHTDAPTRTAY
eukprot:15147600-Alexandrium_andersonii.AAC.1